MTKLSILENQELMKFSETQAVRELLLGLYGTELINIFFGQ
jgi:hypothetical protein